MAAGTNLERTNWYQCSRLLIEGGRAILKEFFMKSYYPQTLDVFLNAKHNKYIIDSLCKKRILNQNQMNILFPNADIELFDITLLSCIILNCVIKGDYVKSDAVKEIRTLRNSVFGHVCTLSMKENDFKTNWKDINTTLLKTKKELCVNVSLTEVADGIKNEELVDIKYMERMKFTIETLPLFYDVLSDIKDVKERLTCIQKTTAETDSCIRDIKETVKRVTHGLEEVKDELKRVHNNPIEVEGWSSGLHDSLVKYYKKYLIKSPITASSRIETNIDDIYAEPLLQLVDHKALCKSSFEKNKMPIHLKDIFGNGDHPYNIYVTGDAGMGKSSLTKHILSSWCNLHEKVETLNDFESALKQYEFLFCISLRHATGKYYIEEMITSQILRQIVASNKTLQGVEPDELLKNIFSSSEKCLIILDGLDEWTAPKPSDVPSISNGVPGRTSSLQCTIITTTRPWKLEELRLKDSEVDRLINVTGVQRVSQLGRNLINCLNNRTETNKKYEDFADCLQRAGVTEMSKIPIILKFLICLWFNGQEFGHSKTDIYTNIIELWFEIAEKKEGVKHLKEIADIGTDGTISTPDIFKKNGKCVRYKAIMSAVATLAFKTSMHSEGRQLVFDSSVDHGVTAEQMKICLKVGILTQSTVRDITCERTSISFPHETFHEYFAALHTGWTSNIHDNIETQTGGKSNIPGNIETNIPSLTLSERGYYFIFLSGMWPSISEQLLEKTMADTFGNCYNYDDKERELFFTQCLLRLCYIECIHQKTPCLKTNFRSIYFNSNLYEIYMRLSLNSDNSKSPRTECEDFFTSISSMCQQNIMQSRGDNVMLDFSELRLLKCLWLDNIEADSLKVSSTLSHLYLNEVKIGTAEGMVDMMSSIAKAKSLQSITFRLTGEQRPCDILHLLQSGFFEDLLNLRMMSYRDINESADKFKRKKIKLSKESTNIVSVLDLSKHTQMKNIKLANICIRELRLGLVTENVDLYNISILTHDKMFSFMESVSSMQSLRILVMENIECTAHRRNDCCSLDLSNHTKLEQVGLDNVSVRGLKVTPLMTILSLIDVSMPSKDELVSLIQSISSMHELEQLAVKNIGCAEHRNNEVCFLDLSKHTKLIFVTLANVCVSGLKVTPVMTILHLRNIKMPNKDDIASLIKSVSSMHELKQLTIENIDCAEQRNNEDCFVDVSNHTKLNFVSLANVCVSGLKVTPLMTSLHLENIKMPNKDELDSLIQNVSSMHELQMLTMKNIDCAEQRNNEDCFLDLSNHTKLKFVSLDNVCVSGLKVTPVMTILHLRNIKMPNNDDIASLMQSVSSMHELEQLTMENIDCAEQRNNEDCFVDLSNHTKLNFVSLDNVCVSGLKVTPVMTSLHLENIKMPNKDELDSLIQSVSSMHELQQLTMENIDCAEQRNNEDYFLDLSNHTQLKFVSLANVCVSGLKVTPVMTILHLKNIKMPNEDDIAFLMEIVSRKHVLKNLTIDNICCSKHQGI